MRQWLSHLFASLRLDRPQQTTYPPSVYLHNSVIEATTQLMNTFGTDAEPHEGILYWAGVCSEKAWTVTTVLAPEASTTPGSYQTTAVANAQVISHINQLRLQLFAQVHGHPTDWVGHSDGDNRGAFMPYKGFYSIVVPYYGRRGLKPFNRCGIHRFEDGGFRQLTEAEIDQKFMLVPTSVDLRSFYAQ